jgi:hypothetical protein
MRCSPNVLKTLSKSSTFPTNAHQRSSSRFQPTCDCRRTARVGENPALVHHGTPPVRAVFRLATSPAIVCRLICKQISNREQDLGSVGSGATASMDHGSLGSLRKVGRLRPALSMWQRRRRDAYPNLLTAWRRQAPNWRRARARGCNFRQSQSQEIMFEINHTRLRLSGGGSAHRC